MSTNPYAAPNAEVADVAAPGSDSNFIEEGRAVSAGRGLNWLIDAWALFKEQPVVWLLQFGATALLMIIVAFIPIIGQLAISLAMPVILAGIMLGARQVEEGEQLAFGTVFAGFKQHLGSLLLLGVCGMIGSFAAMLIAFGIAGVGYGVMGATGDMGGSFMAIMLGALIAMALMIPLYMALWFGPALVMLNDYTVVDAIKTSFFACLKNILPFLVYGVLLFILFAVASIPFGLGFILAIPLAGLAVYTSYRDIFYEG